MRFLSIFAPRLLAACALVAFTISAGAVEAPARWPSPQDKDKKEAKAPPKAEQELADQIDKAPDAAAKFAVAEQFVKKFPKSQIRPKVVEHLAVQAFSPPDVPQKIALAERLISLFPEAGESALVAPFLVDAYIAAQRFDDAFRAGGAWLGKSPNDVRVLTVLSFHSVNLAQRGNSKFVAQGQPYGPKAIELLEAGTKPADMTAELFKEFKDSWLPQLYQTQGLLSLVSGKTDEAFAKLQKAVGLNPSDPITHYLLGTARNEEYTKLATQIKTMSAAAQKTEMTKVNALLDEIIDHYAHTVALAEGVKEHEQLRAQVLQDMTSYYKFRHNGSTDGMQQLIDKYKKPAAAPATPAPAATPAATPAAPPR